MISFIKSKVIYGCESRGDADSPYLTRWTLLQTKWGTLHLHLFHRSDGPEAHDHPWNFWSVVIWPGYQEVVPGPSSFFQVIRRWPLLPVFRPAAFQHRVHLLEGRCRVCHGRGGRGDELYWVPCGGCGGTGGAERPCYTLIWTGPRVREWSFFTAKGWQNWREYFAEKGC